MNKYRIVRYYFEFGGKPFFYIIRRVGAGRWGGYVKKNGQSMDSAGVGSLNPAQFVRSKRTAWYGSVEHAMRHIEKFEKGNEFEVEVEYEFLPLENTQPLDGDKFAIRYSKIFKLPYVERNGGYMDKSGKIQENACPSCIVSVKEDMPKMKDSAWYKDLTHAVKTIVKVAGEENFTMLKSKHIKALPCPFCGTQPQMIGSNGLFSYVQCMNFDHAPKVKGCGVQINKSFPIRYPKGVNSYNELVIRNENLCIKKWNRRVKCKST